MHARNRFGATMLLCGVALAAGVAVAAESPTSAGDCFVAGFESGDADAVAACYAEDAVMWFPGGSMVKGRAAIRDGFAHFLSGVTITDVELTGIGQETVGDTRVAWGTYTIRMVDKATQAETVQRGRYTDVQKKIDGRWLYIVDHPSDDPAPATKLSRAQVTAATAGCPRFHCTAEATGVMSQPIVGSAALAATITLSDASLGTLYAQACSGDGTLLACLVDPPPGTLGTLKIVDTTTRPTMTVVNSDGSLDPSKRLAGSWSHGQVPFMFPDGRVGAGDANSYKIYDFTKPIPEVTSAALPSPVPQGATTMGLTDLANGYGVVARTDGVLTFINMAQGSVVGSLTLTDLNGEGVILVSPPSASNGVLYVAANGDAGYLYAVSMNGDLAPATWNWRYIYAGKTGASPVAATPVATGYSKTLVLLHVPGISRATPHLRGIIDNGSSATVQWYIPLEEDLVVTPSIDEVNHQLYLIYKDDYRVFGYPLHVSGTPPVINATSTPYDLQALAGLSSLKLNGHIGAIQTGAAQDFTLLLAGEAASGSSSSQYMIVLRPTPAHGSAWTTLISPVAARYTAAWNLSPSSTSGIYCPLVVEGGPMTETQNPPPNGLVLMCDH